MRKAVRGLSVNDFPSTGRLFWELIHINSDENILVTGETEFVLPKRKRFLVDESDDLDLFASLFCDDQFMNGDDVS